MTSEFPVAAGSIGAPQSVGGITCYVINLARDADRLAAVTARLNALGIRFRRHPAVNGKRHVRLIKRSLRRSFHSKAKARPMTDGEIGCALSHLTAYRRILREGVQKALILEDDAIFEPAFSTFYSRHLEDLLDRFDLIKIEGIFFPHCSTEATVLEKAGDVDMVLPLRPTLGSAAYAVTRRGAERLVAACATLDDPVDVLLVQYERHRAPFVEARPMLVRQADVESVLESDRVAAEKVMTATPLLVRLDERRRYLVRVLMRLGTWLAWTSRARIGELARGRR